MCFRREVATIVDLKPNQQIIILRSEVRNCNFPLKISNKKIKTVKITEAKGLVTYIGRRYIKFTIFKDKFNINLFQFIR